MINRHPSPLLLDVGNWSGGGPATGVSPTLKFTFEDVNWMNAPSAASPSSLKPRLHLSPSREIHRSIRKRQSTAHQVPRPWLFLFKADFRAWRHYFFEISSSLRFLLLALAISCLSLIGIIILAFKTSLHSPTVINPPSPSTTPVSLSHASKCALVLVLLGLVAFLGWKVMEKAQRQNGKNIKARV